MDHYDEMILQALVRALTQLGPGLGVRQMRTDSEAHRNLISNGFDFPDGWYFGGGSLETHLDHLEESGHVYTREVSVRGGTRKQYLPKYNLRYIRSFSNQEVEIPTQAIGQGRMSEAQVKQLWGDEVKHAIGTPSICVESLKTGAASTIRGGYHRFEVPGLSALYGSPSVFWNHVNVRPIGSANATSQQ